MRDFPKTLSSLLISLDDAAQNERTLACLRARESRTVVLGKYKKIPAIDKSLSTTAALKRPKYSRALTHCRTRISCYYMCRAFCAVAMQHSRRLPSPTALGLFCFEYMYLRFKMSETDFDSPGFEHLRSYESMSRLYSKLLALGYVSEFCPRFKCPPIHKYYFSVPSQNPLDQLYMYTCISSWLIKDKCQMNFELDPEDYERPDETLSAIYEAVCLLLLHEEEQDSHVSARKAMKLTGFSPNKLKQGFGPEVIYTLNILADRALEIMLANARGPPEMRIKYVTKKGQAESLVINLEESQSKVEIVKSNAFFENDELIGDNYEPSNHEQTSGANLERILMQFGRLQSAGTQDSLCTATTRDDLDRAISDFVSAVDEYKATASECARDAQAQLASGRGEVSQTLQRLIDMTSGQSLLPLELDL